jgi:RNA polymerase sigma-70 factor (ECF subfamily)
VYRYFRFHVDSADTAEDLTADTFLRVLEAGDRYDPARSEARVWVFTIARNALRDHFRRTRVRKHVTLATLRDLAVEAPSPEERLLRQEEFDLLLSGVRQLRPGDRELISLRYGSELEFAKIAEVLGMREASVRTRLWRALTRLRELVGEKE